MQIGLTTITLINCVQHSIGHLSVIAYWSLSCQLHDIFAWNWHTMCELNHLSNLELFSRIHFMKSFMWMSLWKLFIRRRTLVLRCEYTLMKYGTTTNVLARLYLAFISSTVNGCFFVRMLTELWKCNKNSLKFCLLANWSGVNFEMNWVACAAQSGHGKLKQMRFTNENNSAFTSLKLSSFTFSARVWNNVHVAGPQVSLLAILKNPVKIKMNI